MIQVNKSVWKILNNAPYSSTLKIFFYIALNQPDEGICGFKISKLQLQIDLNLKQSSILRDLKWLKENLLIQELKQVDESDFMCNPRWVMNNSDFETRKSEWDRRCRLDIQRELRLKQNRRVRQRRLENKQKK